MLVIYKKIQVEFEFGFGSMIFDRVMPLELRKKWEILSFRSLTFEVMHI